jgi:hypothetical protein
MKRVLTLCALAASAVVFAVAGLVGSEGRGGALSQDGRACQFEFRIAKNEAGETRGQLRFEQVANEHGRGVLIEMADPAGILVEGDRGAFRGPGAITTVDPSGVRHTVRGTVQVAVGDGHNRAHPEGRDHFEIQFENSQRNLSFTFSGGVSRGELTVFSR